MDSLLAELQLGPLIATIVYSIVGVLIFGLCYYVFEKLTPFSLRKEIEEDQNLAIAVIIGASFIGISLIIAAAIKS